MYFTITYCVKSQCKQQVCSNWLKYCLITIAGSFFTDVQTTSRAIFPRTPAFFFLLPLSPYSEIIELQFYRMVSPTLWVLSLVCQRTQLLGHRSRSVVIKLILLCSSWMGRGIWSFYLDVTLSVRYRQSTVKIHGHKHEVLKIVIQMIFAKNSLQSIVELLTLKVCSQGF